jgi:hypothetical protein
MSSMSFGNMMPVRAVPVFRSDEISVVISDLGNANIGVALAVLARRNREMGVDEMTNARMIASIRQDAKGLVGASRPDRLPA